MQRSRTCQRKRKVDAPWSHDLGVFFRIRVIDQQGNVARGRLFVDPSFRSEGPNRRHCRADLDYG
jgi:hypothetical protein